MQSKEVKQFFPNVEYNRKRRVKYFVLFAVLTTLLLSMSAWIISSGQYWILTIDVFLIVFIALIPKTLKENPVKHTPILEVTGETVKIVSTEYSRADVRWVKAIVYLGSIGNAVENREFIERVATEKPPMKMLGSLEICVNKDGKPYSEFVVIENVVEALLLFVEDGKTTYRLGYNLGKDYRATTYNLKDYVSEEKNKQVIKVSDKSKIKQLI